MARTTADLPAGIRLTDHISLGVLTSQCPMDVVEQVLFDTERFSARERDLPAHVMVYYVIALALAALLWRAGGNGGDDLVGDDACGFSPAHVGSLITVGATSVADARHTYSNFGSCVDLFAGVDVGVT